MGDIDNRRGRERMNWMVVNKRRDGRYRIKDIGSLVEFRNKGGRLRDGRGENNRGRIVFGEGVMLEKSIVWG